VTTFTPTQIGLPAKKWIDELQMAFNGQGIGAWHDWTPAVTQGAGISFLWLGKPHRYYQLFGLTIIHLNLMLTTVGTAGQPILVSGDYPEPYWESSTLPTIGMFKLTTGAGLSYVGSATIYDGNTHFVVNGASGELGADPAYTLSGDEVLSLTMVYETT
jgi:hypothetical protein